MEFAFSCQFRWYIREKKEERVEKESETKGGLYEKGGNKENRLQIPLRERTDISSLSDDHESVVTKCLFAEFQKRPTVDPDIRNSLWTSQVWEVWFKISSCYTQSMFNFSLEFLTVLPSSVCLLTDSESTSHERDTPDTAWCSARGHPRPLVLASILNRLFN